MAPRWLPDQLLSEDSRKFPASRLKTTRSDSPGAWYRLASCALQADSTCAQLFLFPASPREFAHATSLLLPCSTLHMLLVLWATLMLTPESGRAASCRRKTPGWKARSASCTPVCKLGCCKDSDAPLPDSVCTLVQPHALTTLRADHGDPAGSCSSIAQIQPGSAARYADTNSRAEEMQTADADGARLAIADSAIAASPGLPRHALCALPSGAWTKGCRPYGPCGPGVSPQTAGFVERTDRGWCSWQDYGVALPAPTRRKGRCVAASHRSDSVSFHISLCLSDSCFYPGDTENSWKFCRLPGSSRCLSVSLFGLSGRMESAGAL